MDRDVVRQLGRAAFELDDHRVDTATVLAVQVGVEDVAGSASTRTTLPTSMFSFVVELEVVDLVLVLVDRSLAVGQHGVGKLLDELGEGGRLRGEVGLALQLDDAATFGAEATATAPCEFSRSARPAALAMPCSRSFRAGPLRVAVVVLERLSCVHHPGARRVAQRLHILCAELGH